jgi:hypothetical protein
VIIRLAISVICPVLKAADSAKTTGGKVRSAQ